MIRGKAYLGKKKYQKALQDITTAINLNSGKCAECYLCRGYLFLEKGNFPKADLDFKRAFKINPELNDVACYGRKAGRIYRGRGMSNYLQGNMAEAFRDYDMALKFNDSDTLTCNAFAWLLATCPDKRFRDGKRAVALAERVVCLFHVDNPAYLDTLAAACAEAGEFERAVAIQKRVITMMEAENKRNKGVHIAIEGMKLGHKSELDIVKFARGGYLDAFIARLHAYEAHKPWRCPKTKPSKDVRQRGKKQNAMIRAAVKGARKTR